MKQLRRRLVTPLANRLVYASDAYVDMKSMMINMSADLIDFQRPVIDAADRRLLEFAQLIRPMTGSGLRKVRIGSDHDGGYVMADSFNVLGAMSIGVGSNVSWDQEIAGMDIPVVMFDPTIRRLPDRVRGGRFVRIGLGGVGSSGTYQPLSNLLRLAGFASLEPLLLKIDIEGGEYAAMRVIDGFELQRFHQIVIEFHNLASIKSADFGRVILETARKLSANHFPIHVHANNYDSLARFGNLWFPNAVEMTYLRKSSLPDARPDELVHHEADSPCDSRVPDVNLAGLGRLPSA